MYNDAVARKGRVAVDRQFGHSVLQLTGMRGSGVRLEARSYPLGSYTGVPHTANVIRVASRALEFGAWTVPRYNGLIISSSQEYFVMAKKKTRRAPRGTTPRMYSDTPPAAAAQTPTQPATPAPARAARPSAASARTVSSLVRPDVPLSVEYKYVAGDLKRLGLTALSFFVVLIAAGVIAYFVQR